MYQKSHLLFTTIVASMLLVGCEDGSIGSESNQLTSVDSTEVVGDAEAEEAAAGSTEEIQYVADEVKDEVAKVEATAPKAESSKEASNEDTPETELVQEEQEAVELSEVETAIDLVYQDALHRLLETAGLNKEDYSFSFLESKEFIEIEVREKSDGVAPLEGIYRYMFSTGEILYSDYLTGDFVPFE